MLFIILSCDIRVVFCVFFFFQAEDGIRDLVRSRGLGDVYKRQDVNGDGYSDVIVGANDFYYALDTGTAYIYFGGDLSLIHI